MRFAPRHLPVFLGPELAFPDPRRAGREGLVAIGGDLSCQRLLLAYRAGIFPWYNEEDPILWWSPDPRLVLFPEELHVPRRLERAMAREPFRLTIDRAFGDVIRACAATPRPRQRGTWIMPEMVRAYEELHRAGHAHSLECWTDAGELAGGIYGVAIGRCFFGESMFSRVSNASKVALVTLVRRMQCFGYALLDCQLPNPHLAQFGPRKVTRRAFLELLARHVNEPEPPGMWEERGEEGEPPA